MKKSEELAREILQYYTFPFDSSGGPCALHRLTASFEKAYDAGRASGLKESNEIYNWALEAKKKIEYDELSLLAESPYKVGEAPLTGKELLAKFPG